MAEEIIIWGMVGFIFTGIYLFFNFVSKWGKIKKAAEEKAKTMSAPSDIPSLASRGNDFNEEDLAIYFAARNHLNELNDKNMVQINQGSVLLQSNAAIFSASFKVAVKKHPVNAAIAALVCLPVPIGWIALLIFVGILTFQNTQANNFQNTYRTAINGQKPTSPATNSSDFTEQLEKLSSLYEKGVISEEEFNQAKKKALAG